MKPIHHAALLERAGAREPTECNEVLRRLGFYLEPLRPTLNLPVAVLVCDQCDEAMEVWYPDGRLELRAQYAYRDNIRIGKRKRRQP